MLLSVHTIAHQIIKLKGHAICRKSSLDVETDVTQFHGARDHRAEKVYNHNNGKGAPIAIYTPLNGMGYIQIAKFATKLSQKLSSRKRIFGTH